MTTRTFAGIKEEITAILKRNPQIYRVLKGRAIENSTRKLAEVLKFIPKEYFRNPDYERIRELVREALLFFGRDIKLRIHELKPLNQPTEKQLDKWNEWER